MALKYPLANGNWSNAANWNGGTVPAIGDDVRANGFTVTIDVDINVSQISTLALVPAVAGGAFAVTTSRNITANINAGTTSCLTSASAIIVTIIGNMTGGATSGANGVSFTNAGSILNVTGNATGGSFINLNPHGLNSTGTVIFVGNAFAGVTANAFIAGINIGVTGNLTFTGNATALNNRTYGIQCAGNGTYNGTITGGNSSISAGVNLPSGIHTINSNVIGGTGSSPGILVAGATLTVNGTVTGGNGALGAQLTTTTATFNGDIIGSSSSASQGLYVTDTVSVVTVSTMTFSVIGTTPIYGFVKFKNTAPTVTVRKANNTNQTLVDPSTTDIPIVGNVRDGIVYATGSLTGTFKVPSPLTVALGVPTDNTVGSGVITIGDMGTLLASYIV